MLIFGAHGSLANPCYLHTECIRKYLCTPYSVLPTEYKNLITRRAASKLGPWKPVCANSYQVIVGYHTILQTNQEFDKDWKLAEA